MCMVYVAHIYTQLSKQIFWMALFKKNSSTNSNPSKTQWLGQRWLIVVIRWPPVRNVRITVRTIWKHRPNSGPIVS